MEWWNYCVHASLSLLFFFFSFYLYVIKHILWASEFWSEKRVLCCLMCIIFDAFLFSLSKMQHIKGTETEHIQIRCSFNISLVATVSHSSLFVRLFHRHCDSFPFFPSFLWCLFIYRFKFYALEDDHWMNGPLEIAHTKINQRRSYKSWNNSCCLTFNETRKMKRDKKNAVKLFGNIYIYICISNRMSFGLIAFQ